MNLCVFVLSLYEPSSIIVVRRALKQCDIVNTIVDMLILLFSIETDFVMNVSSLSIAFCSLRTAFVSS